VHKQKKGTPDDFVHNPDVRAIPIGGTRTLAVGIRFEDMSPKLRGMFFGFMEGFGDAD